MQFCSRLVKILGFFLVSSTDLDWQSEKTLNDLHHWNRQNLIVDRIQIEFQKY